MSTSYVKLQDHPNISYEKKVILTSNAANNLGPRPSSSTNYPPWLLYVAAKTSDRKFLPKVQLGNDMIFEVYYLICAKKSARELNFLS